MDVVRWLGEKLDGMIFSWTWRFGGPKNGDTKLVERNKGGVEGEENPHRGNTGGESNGWRG